VIWFVQLAGLFVCFTHASIVAEIAYAVRSS